MSGSLTTGFAEFDEFAQLDPVTAFDASSVRDTPLRVVHAWAAEALKNREQLGSWTAWLRARARATDEGLIDIVRVFDDVGSYQHLPIAFDRVVWRSLIRSIFRAHPGLERFSGLQQEDARRRFRHLDKDMLELNRRKLRADLLQVHPPTGFAAGPKKDWTDIALLRHHSALQRPRIAIRRLVERGHGALRAIKPCWMMSPGSIAQFLPQGLIEFDLVIIDEASQMKPEDSIGAAARGRQLVVVGDPMQLPPTSFFDRLDAVEDEDEEDVDAESVLDLALSVYAPSRHLSWHYRSRHESLIAFSNREFYGSPAPLVEA